MHIASLAYNIFSSKSLSPTFTERDAHLSMRRLSSQILIETAARIADMDGLGNVTLTTIARALGVRKPFLYNYVKGLPDLRWKLTNFGASQLQSQIINAANGKIKQHAILAIAIAYSNFAYERPGLYQSIVISRTYCNNFTTDRAVEELLEVLETVLKAYNLHDNDLIHTVRGFHSVLHGFVSLETSGWFMQSPDRDKSYMQLVKIFIREIELNSGLKV
jgi:AcrR family transcriptional regulator